MWIIERFKVFIETLKYEEKNFSEEVYKVCPDCEGTGSEDFFTTCDFCEGEGFVKKDFKELHSLGEQEHTAGNG